MNYTPTLFIGVIAMLIANNAEAGHCKSAVVTAKYSGSVTEQYISGQEMTKKNSKDTGGYAQAMSLTVNYNVIRKNLCISEIRIDVIIPTEIFIVKGFSPACTNYIRNHEYDHYNDHEVAFNNKIQSLVVPMQRILRQHDVNHFPDHLNAVYAYYENNARKLQNDIYNEINRLADVYHKTHGYSVDCRKL